MRKCGVVSRLIEERDNDNTSGGATYKLNLSFNQHQSSNISQNKRENEFSRYGMRHTKHQFSIELTAKNVDDVNKADMKYIKLTPADNYSLVA